MSYFCKLFLTGPQAKEAASWIFTANMDQPNNKYVYFIFSYYNENKTISKNVTVCKIINKLYLFSRTIYTCALNERGGVEIDATVTPINAGQGEQHDPIFKGQGYYIVAGGASANHTKAHINEAMKKKPYIANITDVTERLGIISIQGPNSRELLQKITDHDLSNENLPYNSSAILGIKCGPLDTHNVRALRVSFVGELGYELHVPKSSCVDVFNAVMSAGGALGVRCGGYRALYALSCEKGYHLWGTDLRSDDTPIEANLGFTCRKKGEYQGKSVVEEQRFHGVHKRLVYLTIDDQLPLYGLEAVYRNGVIVGHLRRGEYGFYLQKPVGLAYISRPDGEVVDNEFITSGSYEIESLGRVFKAKCHLRSPFDVAGKRVLGIYE